MPNNLDGDSTASPGDGNTGAPEFDLFNLPPEAPAIGATAERFMAYDRANPHVRATLTQLARRFYTATGRKRLSVQRCVEIARWDMQIATRGEEEFEINNSFTPYYARLIMLREPDLDGVFETRVSREADRWIAMVKNGLVDI